MTRPDKLGPGQTWGLQGELFSLTEVVHEQPTLRTKTVMYQCCLVYVEHPGEHPMPSFLPCGHIVHVLRKYRWPASW